MIIRNALLPFLEVKTGARKTYSIRPHSHERLSIGFVENGSSRIRCRHLAFDLDCTDLILIPPGVIHLCEPQCPEQFVFRMLFLDPDWLRKAFDIAPMRLAPATAHSNVAALSRKTDFFQMIECDSSQYDPACPDPMVVPLEDQMAAEERAIDFLGHLFFEIFDIRQAVMDPSTGHGKIDPARIMIDENFTDEIRLADLADACHLNRFTLVKQFRKILGLTPHAYLINRRVNLAKQMLRQGSSVADTAACCGFFDQSHFVKTFRNYTGLTPTQFH